MKRAILIIYSLFLLPTIVLAQEPALAKTITFESQGSGTKVLPLATTTGTGFVVFYDHYNEKSRKTELKTRALKASGKIGRRNIISKEVVAGAWTAVWSPKVRQFLLVYLNKKTVYAVAIKSNGVTKGNPSKIYNYDDSFMHLAWTLKDRFVLFVSRGGQVTGQAIKKNGKRFKKEKELTSITTDEALPIAATTQSNGVMILYYAIFDITNSQADLKLAKLNYDLVTQSTTDIASDQSVDQRTWASRFYISVEPKTHKQAIVWKMSESDTTTCQFATLDGSAAFVLSTTDAPHDDFPWGMYYDQVGKRFAILFADTSAANRELFFLTLVNPNGSITNSQKTIFNATGVMADRAVAINSNGKILVCWTPDTGPSVRGFLTN